MASPSKPIISSLPLSTNLTSPKYFCTSCRLHLPAYFNSRRETATLRKTHQSRPLAIPAQELEPWISAPVTRVAGGGRRRRRIHGGIGLQMWALCGFGFWVQGFRCFPWLALNFHMINGLGLSPSSLQLVQTAGSLPMVAKPLYGFFSDAVYIGRDHRLPYISFGGLEKMILLIYYLLYLEKLSLVSKALYKLALEFAAFTLHLLGSELFQSLCIVDNDEPVVMCHRTPDRFLCLGFPPGGNRNDLHNVSWAFCLMGGHCNLLGGLLLLKFPKASTIFFIFSALLTIQLALSLATKEISFYQPSNHHLPSYSLKENLSKQFTDLITVISERSIFYPLLWITASNAVVPLLSGTIFFFQTRHLNLDPLVIGLSKVIGQVMVLCTTLLYNVRLKGIPMRTLISMVQVFYAFSFISDLLLVKQINVRMGIPNEVYVICMSSLAEAIAQFKALPFIVLFSRLCPPGCEGSLFAFFASALCVSSVVSGVLGVGLASLVGVSNDDYSSLPLAIVMQILIALLPLGWISNVPADKSIPIRAMKLDTLEILSSVSEYGIVIYPKNSHVDCVVCGPSN
ncbi:hypothetical protein KSP39_PZI013779 [Platanthera zijinensis]|uniref:Uncharacterized protein n=1 Tax=Platanthera zijinensis TaxID=2320716 RepID=A0AAP0G3A3_9ASPA